MRAIKYYAVILSLLASGLSAQQDPQYNLYQFNPLVINPAYTGARDALQVIGAHRQQWAGFPGAPVTTCLSVHAPVFNRKLGVGLTLVNDEIGPRNIFSAYGNVSYILKVAEGMKLSFGVNAGYNRYQINFSEVTFKSGEAPAELYQNITPGTLDINSGILLRSSSFFVSVSASHLNNPNVYTYRADAANAEDLTYRLRTHMFVMGGYSFILSDNAVFAPTLLFKSLGSVNSADANMNFLLYKKFWVGAFYRYNYGVGGIVQYLVTSKFKVGYSYDAGLNQSGRLGGSHEVMISYDFLPNRTHFINPRFL